MGVFQNNTTIFLAFFLISMIVPVVLTILESTSHMTPWRAFPPLSGY
jgi:hypothetical protein